MNYYENSILLLLLLLLLLNRKKLWQIQALIKIINWPSHNKLNIVIQTVQV